MASKLDYCQRSILTTAVATTAKSCGALGSAIADSCARTARHVALKLESVCTLPDSQVVNVFSTLDGVNYHLWPCLGHGQEGTCVMSRLGVDDIPKWPFLLVFAAGICDA
jgi:hypothetical protein